MRIYISHMFTWLSFYRHINYLFQYIYHSFFPYIFEKVKIIKKTDMPNVLCTLYGVQYNEYIMLIYDIIKGILT